MIAILDNIRSIHNVGSIFRTGDAAGVKKIYLCGITPAPVDRFGMENSRLKKVSIGAEKVVSWQKCKNTREAVRDLKKQGYKIIALEQSAKSISVFDKKIKNIRKEKVALILGAEVEGVSQDILNLADYIIEIPMRGQKESLNVAVAFGIAIYQILNNN